ncbi:hypothetical protein CA13_58930 [Planctomycetes bacterium CA13]|uniref:Uncharacterized protein n=1 Tax=Novipirellula herctigrandis TaxID=2527986 RepID=A0A5C5ZB83_9BACT|nr:hypothetical protein CA13_58930 [Planctomycetes bacterium CA13]
MPVCLKSVCFAISFFAITSYGAESEQASESSSNQLVVPVQFDASNLAFYPKRWKEHGQEFDMLVWEGENVALLTSPGEYDSKVIAGFVSRLDDGYRVYQDIIGVAPRPYKQYQEKATICAVKGPEILGAYALGFVGYTGIEVSAFYRKDLPGYTENPNSFAHYYFYEMGRNHFVFGDRHSLFTTGYAVFMRYVCMDELKCEDADLKTRATIEKCEQLFADSELPFLDAFTNLASGEKSNRIQEGGVTVVPSDQPVMYATAMLKLRKDLGDPWVRRFYHLLRKCKPYPAKDAATAMPQCFNWLVCASAAANKDLTSIFADRWRMPMTAAQRNVMQDTDWTDETLTPASIVDLLISQL